MIFRGEMVRGVPKADMVDALMVEAERLVAEGVEARIAAADSNAEAEAEADRLRPARRDGSRPEPHLGEDRASSGAGPRTTPRARRALLRRVAEKCTAGAAAVRPSIAGQAGHCGPSGPSSLHGCQGVRS